MSDLKSNVEKSRKAKATLVKRFGFVPMSVLRGLGRGKLTNSLFVFQNENPSRTGTASFRNSETRMGGNGFDERRELRVVGGSLDSGKRRGKKNKGRAAVTGFPAEVVQFFVKYYSEPGQLYLDPFMGRGVSMQVAKLLGLDYIGFDISEESFEFIESVRVKIDDAETLIATYNADSRDPHQVEDGIGDFSFHSPPYWDIEYYGDEPEQVGAGSYEEFMESMENIYRAWLPKFKPGAFHVVNVNDFRRDGRFYPYHADTIHALRVAGWEIHDTWIIDGLVGGLSRIFAVQRFESRIAPKVHEYAIVTRAPQE
jgi:DNA modification methylase